MINDELLEDVQQAPPRTTELIALVSIAISLKRIADAICESSNKNGETVFEAVGAISAFIREQA